MLTEMEQLQFGKEFSLVVVFLLTSFQLLICEWSCYVVSHTLPLLFFSSSDDIILATFPDLSGV